MDAEIIAEYEKKIPLCVVREILCWLVVGYKLIHVWLADSHADYITC